MTESAPPDDGASTMRGGGLRPRTIERVESALIVALALAGTIAVDPDRWWFPLAAFLGFDVSMLGYLRSTATGAFWYNAVHTFAWPVILASIALMTWTSTVSTWLMLLALAWALHVAADRMLGYGLKLPDAFTHTHLGWIGPTREGTR